MQKHVLKQKLLLQKQIELSNKQQEAQLPNQIVR